MRRPLEPTADGFRSDDGLDAGATRSRRRSVCVLRCQRGLTLIELAVVLGIIATLSTIAVLVYRNVTERTQYARAVADIATMSGEISTFASINLRFPNDLAEIGRASLLDPWGRPYEYTNLELDPGNARKDHALHPINTDFDLYSRGKDGDTAKPLTAVASRDDIIRANDGQYIGLAANY
ncbi:MAG TPA: prepilin-type N-terminal cleavage/methylation domain-containing protein [Methylomirabilota bacterium]|jgi:general secretion pathway protein G